MLRPDRQVYISRNLDWGLDQNTIVNFFDYILKSAIESSPITTPCKERNRTPAKENFPKYLGRVFICGEEGAEDDDEGDALEYNVIEVDGISLLQRC